MVKRLKGYKLLLAKAYFDKGWGLTSYMKYVIALFGLYSIGENISMTIMMEIAVVYSIGCYFLGRMWYNYRLIDTENEINNMFNPFQREMREKLIGIPNNRKI